MAVWQYDSIGKVQIALECNRKDVLEMTYDDCDQFQREHFKTENKVCMCV